MDSSNAPRLLADPVSLQADRGQSIRRAPALQVPAAAPGLPEDVPDLARDLDSADRVLVDLAVHAPAEPVGYHRRVKLRVRSARQDGRVAATSSIQKPRKAR